MAIEKWNNLVGLPNFKDAMAILILVLANYLLDIVSWYKKFWVWGFLDDRKMHFPVLFHRYISVLKHPILCTMYHEISIHLPHWKSQLLCQFNCQSKYLSYLTALSLTPGSTAAFFFEWSLRGSWFILQKLRKKDCFIVFEWWKKQRSILCENTIFIGQYLLQLQKNCMMSKNNDDLQLLLLCFVHRLTL